MQDLPLIRGPPSYASDMKAGRPSKKTRPPFGERLHALREQAGLSQQQLAERLGLPQTSYAYWERHPVALRPDQIVALANALGVSLDQLFGDDAAKRRTATGPTGKMRQLFEAASRLPRSQQQKVAAVLEPFIIQHSGEA